MMRFPRLFPLALVLALGLLTAWLDVLTRYQSGSLGVDRADPDYVAERFVATRFDEAGRLKERMTATRGWEIPKDPDIHFQKPHLELFELGQLQYTIDGDTGRYNKDKATAWFDDKVTLRRQPTPERDAIKIDTSAMTVDTRSSVASSRAPVTFYYQQSVGNAVGFVYDHKAQKLDLLSNVRITYVK